MDIPLTDTLNARWKNDKSGFGFKMLQKMGWKEDKGLGKNESGTTTNVKVKKREDGLGLGMEKGTDEAGNKAWNDTTSSFNDVLNLLKASYAPSDGKAAKKSSKASKHKISVGIKYKKISESKNLSTKSDAEKRAVLGAAAFNIISTTVHQERAEKRPRDDLLDTIPKKKKKVKKNTK